LLWRALGQASLNPDGTRITAFEIGEPDALSLHPTWLDASPQKPGQSPSQKIV
jgi:hypothetical protein